MSSLNFPIEDLPLNLLVDVLSRLPVKTIVHCKCVCNKWRNLLSTSYFVNLHLSRSPTGLLIHHQLETNPFSVRKPGILRLVEIDHELDRRHLHHDPVMSLDLNLGPVFQDAELLLVGSINGLVCLWHYDNVDDTYICNPVTREYMILPRQRYYRESYAIIVYGFGLSSSSAQYKVVRIFQGDIPPNPSSWSRPSLLEGEVYTLGTGHWRSLGHVPYWLNGFDGPFLNGHAHWIVLDVESPEKLCTFDFENETFGLFPSPPHGKKGTETNFSSLGVLKGRLSQSFTVDYDEFTIWVMKEYGVKESWNKVVEIKPSIEPHLDWLLWESVCLTESLKDGTILMVYYEDKLVAYDPNTKSLEDTKVLDRYLTGMAYVPSFVRLLDFESENVHSFK